MVDVVEDEGDGAIVLVLSVVDGSGTLLLVGVNEILLVVDDIGTLLLLLPEAPAFVPLASRYQFDAGSPRHSPTVTGRYPR